MPNVFENVPEGEHAGSLYDVYSLNPMGKLNNILSRDSFRRHHEKIGSFNIKINYKFSDNWWLILDWQ